MSKPTLGPWVVYLPTRHSLPHIRARNGVYVMARNGRHPAARQMADARLIASAPELLSNLKFAVSVLSAMPAIGFVNARVEVVTDRYSPNDGASHRWVALLVFDLLLRDQFCRRVNEDI